MTSSSDAQLFTWVLEIQTEILTLAQQMLFPSEPNSLASLLYFRLPYTLLTPNILCYQ